MFLIMQCYRDMSETEQSNDSIRTERVRRR